MRLLTYRLNTHTHAQSFLSLRLSLKTTVDRFDIPGLDDKDDSNLKNRSFIYLTAALYLSLDR